MKNEKDLISISKVCEIANIDRHKLKVFDEKGILTPANIEDIEKVRNINRENKINGKKDKDRRAPRWKYRYQDLNIIETVNTFHEFREFGYTYDKIKDIIEGDDLELMSEFKEINIKLQEKISDLQRKQFFVEYMIDQLSVLEKLPKALKEYSDLRNSQLHITKLSSLTYKLDYAEILNYQNINNKDAMKNQAEMDIAYNILFLTYNEPEESSIREECLEHLIHVAIKAFNLEQIECGSIEKKVLAAMSLLNDMKYRIEAKKKNLNNIYSQSFDEIVGLYGEHMPNYIVELYAKYANKLALKNSAASKYVELMQSDEFFEESFRTIVLGEER